MMGRSAAGIGIFFVCLAANPILEADPVLHVLVQLPLLGWSGGLLQSHGIGARWRWAQGGVAPLLLVLFGVAFWMLPRSIDGAVTHWPMTVSKFVSLPLIGALLSLSWSRAHALLKAFVRAQAVSMAGFMAFLFTHSPVRLCNSYLIEDQWRLGEGFLWAGIALALFWTLGLFRWPVSARPDPSNNGAAGS